MGAFGSSNTFPSLNPGDLRHWITFLFQTTIQGESGPNIIFQAASPATGAWAKIEAVRGSEAFRAGQDVTQLLITVTMWWQPVPAAMHILSSSGAEYNVLSTENVLLLNHILVLNCMAIGAQANTGG